MQATPPAAAVERLNQNLSRLSRSPQDVNALLGAAQAALDLGDVQAANGFFTRANMVAPANAQAKLGLAIVNLALKQPGEAATYFDAADALGEHAQGRLADRGLAYDLTGQQEKAQRDYQAALRANPADQQARLRYAVSLGISGELAAAEKQLEPALAAQDREAWRARAFILAMNGRQAEARKISQTVMPRGLADALDPYMARVALLTGAQKAAAFHYGEFPSAVLRAAAPAATPDVQPPRVLAGNAKKKRKRDRDQEQATLARAEPEPALAPPAYREEPARTVAAPAPATQAALASGQRMEVATATAPVRHASPRPQTPPPATPRPAASSAAAPAPTPGFSASAAPAREPIFPATPPPAAQPEAPAIVRPEIAAPVAGSGAASQPAAVQGPVDPAAATSPQTLAVAPTPAAPAAEPRPRPRGLADAMLAMNVPESERQATVAPVDLAAIARAQAERRRMQEKAAADKAKRDAAAKAKAEADAKAKAAAEEKARLARNPARIWVQIATGRDVAALAFDMRRMRRSYADALGDQSGWTAEWGATRRLLVGPYPSAAKAKDAAAAIKKSGGDAFVWTSEAGEEVAKIGGK